MPVPATEELGNLLDNLVQRRFLRLNSPKADVLVMGKSPYLRMMGGVIITEKRLSTFHLLIAIPRFNRLLVDDVNGLSEF